MELFKIGFVSVRLVDIIDISIVTILLYKLFEVIRGTVAVRIIVVLISIFLVWKLVDLLDLVLLKSILDQVFLGLGAVALVIIFASEIRRFLAEISRNTLLDRLFTQAGPRVVAGITYREVVDAVKYICERGDGALIVIVGRNLLEAIQNTGDRLNADVSARLIESIFQKYSPLHDGGMIIQDNKIVAARCILPIHDKPDLPPHLGMRHRAAIGVTEISDALAIAVSEERQEISIAYMGKLSSNLNYTELDEIISSHFQKLTE
jgi:uncharacterized protein (TIGR00159 family)